MKKIELNFPRIEGHYGVHQAWMGENTYISNRSCGLAGLLNILIYEKIVSVTSVEEAAAYLNAMVKPWLPRPWGIPSFSILQTLMERFCPKTYRLVLYKGKFTVPEVKHFILEALEKNHPLLLLTYNHKNRHFHNHWITITGLLEKDEKDYFIASNWAKRRIYSLEDYLLSHSLYKSLGYFEKIH